MRNKSGTSMNRIENVNKVSSIWCECKKCYHSIKKGDIFYCKYYDLINPRKKKCSRYYERELRKLDKNEMPVKKNPTFPWEK